MAASRFVALTTGEVGCDIPAAGVAMVTLNRPDRLNAYTFPLCADVLRALAAFRDDDALKVLVLTGAGTRAFCAGGDLAGDDPTAAARVAEVMGHGRDVREGLQAVILALAALDKPTLAMIRGYAIAGGLALALACDFRFASDLARLGDTSTRAAALPDEGGAWLFPRAMGYDRALRMTLMHEIYPASEAERLGLVTAVYADDQLEPETLAFCEALAGKAPYAVRLTKLLMRKGLESTLAASMVDAQMAVMVNNPTADTAEGIAAFREKRPPVFQGR